MYITPQGGPGEATKVLAYHIYNTAFVSSQFGYASAIAMILLAMIVVITLIQFKFESGSPAICKRRVRVWLTVK